MQTLTEEQKQILRDHIAALQAVLDDRNVEFEKITHDGEWEIDANTPVQVWANSQSIFGCRPRRIKPQPKYRPFQPTDSILLVGRVVKTKKCINISALITKQSNIGVSVNGCDISYDGLFEHYTFDDGTPCGVRE